MGQFANVPIPNGAGDRSRLSHLGSYGPLGNLRFPSVRSLADLDLGGAVEIWNGHSWQRSPTWGRSPRPTRRRFPGLEVLAPPRDVTALEQPIEDGRLSVGSWVLRGHAIPPQCACSVPSSEGIAVAKPVPYVGTAESLFIITNLPSETESECLRVTAFTRPANGGGPN